jgi:hypothetical protein
VWRVCRKETGFNIDAMKFDVGVGADILDNIAKPST